MSVKKGVVTGGDAKRFLDSVSRQPTSAQKAKAAALYQKGRALLAGDGYKCRNCGHIHIPKHKTIKTP